MVQLCSQEFSHICVVCVHAKDGCEEYNISVCPFPELHYCFCQSYVYKIYLYVKGMCYGALTGYAYFRRVYIQLVERNGNVQSTMWVLYFEHVTNNSYKLLCGRKAYLYPTFSIIFQILPSHPFRLVFFHFRSKRHS